jgi:hypothetical protein
MISFRPPARLQVIPVRPGQLDERQRQRAARRQDAVDRAGRDEQRLDRAKGHSYLVFLDRATADEVMREIAATPILADGLEWPVQMWDEDTGAGIGAFEASDGRVALGHHWTSAERTWIADYVDGWRFVEILDALPVDWTPEEDDQPGRR